MNPLNHDMFLNAKYFPFVSNRDQLPTTEICYRNVNPMHALQFVRYRCSQKPEKRFCLYEMREGKSVLSIAHRLSTLLRADHLIFLDRGWTLGRLQGD